MQHVLKNNDKMTMSGFESKTCCKIYIECIGISACNVKVYLYYDIINNVLVLLDCNQGSFKWNMET